MERNNYVIDNVELDETDAKPSKHNISGLDQETVKNEYQEVQGKPQSGKVSDTNVYPMSSTPRGMAMIINNGAFQPESGFNPRHGSDVDVQKLANLFQYLGFAVFVKQDLAQAEIMESIDDFKQQFEETIVDMCIFCIMSHGSGGNLVDIQGYEIDVEEEILKKFYNTQCPALQGKPKLFLLQYCRGGELDLGVEVPSEFRDALPVDKLKLQRISKLPAVTDFLIANSTVPGFVSNRNMKYGTWFFQCLVEVFKENAKHMDIRDMFDQITRVLNEKESNDNNRRKQTFEVTSRGFYKKLYFNPYEVVDEQYENDDEEYKNDDDTVSDKQQKNKKGFRKRVMEAWKALVN
eukprot:GFUD01030782.1.p1 GENE.GFUD01030782.1~~GFUD01030782.1.p1  ORF type:complete len:349 (-),score=99.63 GFUD01030782.1:482-1528(-)